MSEYERLKNQKAEIIKKHREPGTKCPFGCPHESETALRTALTDAQDHVKKLKDLKADAEGIVRRLHAIDCPCGRPISHATEMLDALSPAPEVKAEQVRCPGCGEERWSKCDNAHCPTNDPDEYIPVPCNHPGVGIAKTCPHCGGWTGSTVCAPPPAVPVTPERKPCVLDWTNCQKEGCPKHDSPLKSFVVGCPPPQKPEEGGSR